MYKECLYKECHGTVFLGKKTKKNEYNRSSTIEDLPLLVVCVCVCALGGGGHLISVADPDPGSQTHIFENIVKKFWVKTSIIL
jgi:hypothetical protein